VNLCCTNGRIKLLGQNLEQNGKSNTVRIHTMLSMEQANWSEPLEPDR
jgi:hypothetical protein